MKTTENPLTHLPKQIQDSLTTRFDPNPPSPEMLAALEKVEKAKKKVRVARAHLRKLIEKN